MNIIIALPDNNYYLWQMLVQIANFSRYGYDKNLIYVIGQVNDELNENLQKIIESDKIKSKFFIYEDNRDHKNIKYASTLRPFILSKFFKEYPEYTKETYLYTDPDVLFTKYLDLNKFDNDDIWYVSNTNSYISADYIKSKSPELFEEMCDIVGVKTKLIESYNDNSGGAQYIIKNVNHEFWDKVYVDSEKLYNYMIDTSRIYSPEHPIQAWTADMWAVLWNALLMGNDVKIHKELDFCWATDMKTFWDEFYIFHNAGLPPSDEFSKTKYQNSPFKQDLPINGKFATDFFVNEIKYTEIKYDNLIW